MTPPASSPPTPVRGEKAQGLPKPIRPDPAERIPVLLRNIATSSTLSEAQSWAVDLATLLGQTDPCPKCDGRGSHHKHINCGHAQYDAWIRECNTLVSCRKCNGAGRLMKPSPAPQPCAGGDLRGRTEGEVGNG